MSQAKDGMKKCTRCGEIKPVSEFRNDKSSKDGHFTWCKKCVSEYSKSYYKINQKKCLNYGNKYVKCVKNPSCNLVGGNGAEFVVFKCPICGKEFRKSKAEVDIQYKRRGQTVFYCSRACVGISQRKEQKL